MTYWALWGARNEKLEPPDECVDRARQRWFAFVKANVVTPFLNSGTSRHIKWMVPPPGWLKVNIMGPGMIPNWWEVLGLLFELIPGILWLQFVEVLRGSTLPYRH
ncbi:hypothetical protein C1H46_018265 [Malus baccata]|uniref:Uncharacterized protein n=1 Tax=Malus baccata TaxID=106549 RepID=A0A540MC35_MALBA|nr:hypothetical protein C1H46_018265 [Malus baccata]